MTKQEKIKVSAGEDLLAFIPHIVGYWPESSVVCIGMARKSLRATMRLDLPAGEAAEPVDLENFAAVAAGQLASDKQADGSLVAIFGGPDWTDPESFAQQDLFDALRAALAGYGMPVRDAWYVGRDHWRSISCRNSDCCPWPGHSNSKITGSFVSAELVFRGSSVDQSPRERVPAMTVVQDPGRAAKVEKAMAPFLPTLGVGGAAENQLVVTLGAWERALSHWPEQPDTTMNAYLVASLSNAAVRDAVLVSLATTPEASLAGVLGVGYLQQDLPEPAVPGNWYGGSQAAGYDIEIADESDEAIENAGEVFSDVLLGGSVGESRRVQSPNWTRMDQAEELLLFLASSVGGEGKAPLLCVLGWIQWCRGRGTWAGAYFLESQKYIPGYKLAQLLDRLLQAGFVAAWAKDQQTAWPGYRRHAQAA